MTQFGIDVRLRGEQTDGALRVMENAVPAGWEGPPLHHQSSPRASVSSRASSRASPIPETVVVGPRIGG